MSEFKEFSAHFPEKISKSLCKFVNETVFKDSRYLFFKTVLGLQYAHCTHCNQRHRSEIKLKHKQKESVRCPNCGSNCQVRAAGVSRKYMQDTAVVIWYEKSVINSKAVTARIVHVTRDYSGSYENVETGHYCSHRYLFEPGKTQHWDGFTKRKSVFSAFDRLYGKKFVSHANIRQAVKGTMFQYSTWDQFTKYDNRGYVSDMVDFFDLAARFPCVEYLSKLGFKKCIWERLYGNPTGPIINWRGKTIEKVLRIDKRAIRDIQTTGLEWGVKQLSYFQNKLKNGKQISAYDAFLLSQIDHERFTTTFQNVMKYASKEEIWNYLLKQFKRNHWDEIADTMRDWRDYLGQCKELGMRLSEDRYLFPNDLHAAHQRMTGRIKYKKSEALEKQLQERLANEEPRCYENSRIIIRPISSISELFQEGEKLNHCVGGYAKRFSKGETELFAVRRKAAPEQPYYTLQVTSNKFVQCRGLKNCSMTKQVQDAVNMFMKIIEIKKKPKSVTAIKNQTIRQEAVV
ncbi:hypothetical protein EBB07_00930 [Paenibacillaceae bacterium]|nr:hypothetical protein EBB07_00930 [Paenibacillaceae bacterium]